MHRLLIPDQETHSLNFRKVKPAAAKRLSEEFTEASTDCVVGSFNGHTSKFDGSKTSRDCQSTVPPTNVGHELSRSNSKAILECSKALLYERKVAESNLSSLMKQYEREKRGYATMIERYSHLKRDYMKMKAQMEHSDIRMTSVKDFEKRQKQGEQSAIEQLARKEVPFEKYAISMFTQAMKKDEKQQQLQLMRSLLREEAAECLKLRELNSKLQQDIHQQRQQHSFHNKKLNYWEDYIALQDQNKALKKIVKDLELVMVRSEAYSKNT